MAPEDLRRLTIEGDDLVVSLIPELGAKIERLSRRGGPNVLLEPPERTLRRAAYGAPFEDYDTSGWDECFPSVAPSGEVPDHGELWSVPWEVLAEGNSVLCEVRGVATPCRFRRRLTLAGRTARFDYEIASEADRPLDVLWSAHPLLSISPGSELQLPRSLRAQANPTLAPKEAGTAAKLFSGRLGTDEGACAYRDRATGETVSFRFDPERVPYLGLWLCLGGWPTSRPAKHYTIALEPCLAPCDSLAEAIAGGHGLTLAPRASFAFWLEVSLVPS
jgi:galactose mutarotase-like enzyme